MAARKNAKQILAMASRGREASRKVHEHAHGSLNRVTDRRAAFTANVVSPELARFSEQFARFADFRFADYAGPAAPVVGQVDEAQLRELNDLAGDAAKAAGLGGASGGLLVAGTWTAVTTWGTASTGTAIASLNGIAASNAALAALGGGSLATGGGGIAAGTAVLGSVAAAPVLLVAGAVYWHLGQKELSKARANADELDSDAAKYDADRARIVRVRQLVERLEVTAQLLTGALALRLGHIDRWPPRAGLGDCTPAEHGWLTRTTRIAETLSVVATTPAWTADGNPNLYAKRAVADAERILDEEQG